MALRNLRIDEDPVLRIKCKVVTKINDKVKQLIEDMYETMDKYQGVGLAAPQVGILKRIAVIDIDEETRFAMINPELLESSGTQCGREGCLSIPGKEGRVERPAYVKVKILNEDGEEVVIEAEGYLAVAICHEMDHLDGILYTDKVIDEPEEDDDDYEEDDVKDTMVDGEAVESCG